MKNITRKEHKPVIIFDYDDVLFDFLGHVVKEYNKRAKKRINISQVKDWDLSKAGDILIFKDIIKDPSLWEKIPEKNNSMQVLQRLINDGRWTILICTACSNLEEYAVKSNMIAKYLPGFHTSKILSVEDKYLIRGDLIIDDKIDNLKQCAPYMRCLMMDMPHNRQNNDFERIYDIDHIPALLEELFN